MAEPNTQYEYGRTPEETAPGILGFFNFLRGPVADAFTPERRAVITPSKTTYTEADGMYYPNTTPGVYGPVERGVEYMPVVQGAKSAYDFLGELISSGEKRGETADALVKGIGTLLEDQKRAGINAALGRKISLDGGGRSGSTRGRPYFKKRPWRAEQSLRRLCRQAFV